MLRLNLSNGKLIVIGANHIMALLSSGSGDGSNLVLGGGVSYDVTQKPEEILAMIDALEAKKAEPVKRPASPATRPAAAQPQKPSSAPAAPAAPERQPTAKTV